ncbi:MAG TPA: hypothetical protein VGO11_22205 [Chthoniobacteraceae bacterium]|nr:hypothetical protein [Chthoniobacteraceae bacterium]
MLARLPQFDSQNHYPGREWRRHREWFERSALGDLLGGDYRLGAAHAEAGQCGRAVVLTLPELPVKAPVKTAGQTKTTKKATKTKRSKTDVVTFTFALERKQRRQMYRREGRDLLRSNLTETPPRSGNTLPRERTSRSPLPSATATVIVSLWTSNPTKRIGLPMRLSVDEFFTREHRARFGACVFAGATRTPVRATRGSAFTAGKRTFFLTEAGGFTEGTQPLGPGVATRLVRTALQSLLFSAFVLSANGVEPAKAPEALVADFEAGRFLPGPINRTGWTMETSTGGSYHRADLNRQAQELAGHGIKAFPTAFALLDHREMYMRYIGVKTLQSITMLSPDWFFFGTPGTPFNGKTTWSDEAKRQWKEWYDKQPK